MTHGRWGTLRLLLPWWVRRLPADLAASLVAVAVVNLAVFGPVVRETVFRAVLGLAFVLFVPGYVVLAALFPEAGEPPTADADDAGPTDRRGIDGVERVTLSFGLSLAVTPLIGLALNFTPLGIRLVPIVVATNVVVLAATGIAAARRWALPEAERFRVHYGGWLASTRSELLSPQSRVDAVLNGLLVLSILLAVSSVAYAVAVPPDGERVSEFYALTENETGDLVTADYPTEFERGESRSVVLGIGNEEHERTDYTVVAAIHRVAVDDGGAVQNVTVDGPNATGSTPSLTVTERRELDRLSTTLEHNETWHQDYEVEPTMTGDDLRLTFMLYRGEPPARPTVDNAYRRLHLWVDVAADRGD